MSNLRNLALWVVVALLLIALFNMFSGPMSQQTGSRISYSQFINDAKDGQIAAVKVEGNQVTGQFKNGQPFTTVAPDNSNYVDQLTQSGVQVEVVPIEESTLLSILISRPLH